MTVTLYGIPNCDKVKAALAWLRARRVPVDFHDYRKSGAPPALLRRWLEQVAWPDLVNRSGTTWRKLAEERRTAIVSAGTAVALMTELPSLIRRPVVEHDGRILVGFDEKRYRLEFGRDE